MGFLEKLKKTILTSFFGEPERERRPSKSRRSKKAPKRKLKPASKSKKSAPKKKKRFVLPPKKKLIKLKPKPLKILKPVKALLPKPAPKSGRTSGPAAQIKKLPAAKTSQPPKAQKPEKSLGTFVGTVTHFFPQVHVAAIKIEAKNLSVGDEVLIKGVTTHFKTQIESMQINRVPVTQAPKGSEIGILVKKRVREGDQVFKL